MTSANGKYLHSDILYESKLKGVQNFNMDLGTLAPMTDGTETFKCHFSLWKYDLAPDVELEILQNLVFGIASSKLMELQQCKRAASEVQINWLTASSKAGCKEFI